MILCNTFVTCQESLVNGYLRTDFTYNPTSNDTFYNLITNIVNYLSKFNNGKSSLHQLKADSGFLWANNLKDWFSIIALWRSTLFRIKDRLICACELTWLGSKCKLDSCKLKFIIFENFCHETFRLCRIRGPNCKWPATNCLSYVCNDLQVKVFAPFHCELLLLIKNTISTIRKISSVLFALAFWLFLLPSDANPALE